MNKNGNNIEKKLGYSFTNKEYLQLALTHKSASTIHNERMEFLGDSILSSVITTEIYTKYIDKTEGDLSRMRSTLINREKLIEIALRLDINQHIKTNQIERKQHNNKIQSSILANTLEAIIGAIFLDSNWMQCYETIIQWYNTELSCPNMSTIDKDPKTKLQEYLQSLSKPLPKYHVVSTKGHSHEQTFVVTCCVPGVDLSSKGEGTTRKKAEQEAAKIFLTLISKKDIL